MSLISTLASIALSASVSGELAEGTANCSATPVCQMAIAYGTTLKNGSWKLELFDIRRSGFCLSQVKIILDPMIRNIKIPAQISWNAEFHPDQLQLDKNSRKIVWVEEHIGSFVSERQVTRSSIIEAQYKVRVIDASTIDVTVDFIVKDSPPELGMKDCVVSADYVASHVPEVSN